MTPSDDLVRLTKERVEMWRTFATHMEHWMPSTPNPESCPVVLIEPDQLERLCDLALAQLASADRIEQLEAQLAVRAEPVAKDSIRVPRYLVDRIETWCMALSEHGMDAKFADGTRTPNADLCDSIARNLRTLQCRSAPPDRAEPQPVALLQRARDYIRNCASRDDMARLASKIEAFLSADIRCIECTGDGSACPFEGMAKPQTCLTRSTPPACALGGEANSEEFLDSFLKGIAYDRGVESRIAKCKVFGDAVTIRLSQQHALGFQEAREAAAECLRGLHEDAKGALAARHADAYMMALSALRALKPKA